MLTRAADASLSRRLRNAANWQEVPPAPALLIEAAEALEAVRRVAPDREMVAWFLWCANQGYLTAEDRAGMENWFLSDPANDHPDDDRAGWLALADALLASGVLGVPAQTSGPAGHHPETSEPFLPTVPGGPSSSIDLGVPADQRTADRETIARALWDSRYPAVEWDYALGLTENAGLVARLAGCRKDADAVLAVLVPADQVRAETLEAWARTVRQEAEADERGLPDIPSGQLPQGSRNMLNGVTRAAERANGRAAEYRKEVQ